MKKNIFAVLFAACLALGLTVGGFAQAPVNYNALPVLKVSLQVITPDGPAGKVEYTDMQQVSPLISLLPGEEDRISVSPSDNQQIPDGGIHIEMSVGTVGTTATTQSVVFYFRNIASEKLEDGTTAWYNTKPGTWDLLLKMTDYNPYAFKEEIKFKDETVTEVYSLLYKSRTYHRVIDPDGVEKIVKALEEKEPDETKTIGNVGFIIVTEEGRYPFYFDADSDPELVSLSASYTKENPRIQWIAYMDPAKISSIEYSGAIRGDFSLVNYGQSVFTSLKTTDEQTIQRIAAYLKDIRVLPETERYERPIKYKETPSLVNMTITFESGAEYHLTGHNSAMSISASTMEDEYITYYAGSSQMKALRDFISMMPGAEISNMPSVPNVVNLTADKK